MNSEIEKIWNISSIDKIEELRENVMLITTIKNEKYILKEKKDIERIDLEISLLSHLKKTDVPVSLPIKTIKESFKANIKNKTYCVYKYLEGEPLKLEKNSKDKEIYDVLGFAIGKLHIGLETYNDEFKKIDDMNLETSLFNWAIPKIKELTNDEELLSIIIEIENDIQKLYSTLAKQFIHRDPNIENIIFFNKKLNGFIDFELCMKGFKSFDVSYLLTGLLMSDFKNEKSRENWLVNIKYLLEGYERINNLSKEEKDSIYFVLLSIQLTFIAYFYELKNFEMVDLNNAGFKWIYKNKNNIRIS